MFLGVIPELVTSAEQPAESSNGAVRDQNSDHCKEQDFAQVSAGFVWIICVFFESMHCVFYHITGKIYSIIISSSGRSTNRPWVSMSKLKSKIQTKVKKQDLAAYKLLLALSGLSVSFWSPCIVCFIILLKNVFDK